MFDKKDSHVRKEMVKLQNYLNDNDKFQAKLTELELNFTALEAKLKKSPTGVNNDM